MMLSSKTMIYRRKAEAHPLVKCTLEAEQEIRAEYPWKGDWLFAIQAKVAVLGLTKGRKFAEAVGFGLRSRMKLLPDKWCVQTKGGGCQCNLPLNHQGLHRCCCGKQWTQAESYHGRRKWRRGIA